ncbi:MAG: stage II sporulation protein M [Anaeromyxobacter sp.]
MSGARRPRSVAALVRDRRASWERLEALAARAVAGRLPLADIEELDQLQRRASADLALLRSRFGGSEAEGYLSQLLARVQAALHRRARGGAGPALRRAWAEIPLAVQAHRPQLALAALLLAAGALAGGLAVAWAPDAAAWLVPEPVRSAVAAGRLWTGHLLSAAPGVSGAALAHNNVSAAALAFGLGALTAGLGTAALLLLNGLLLGAVLTHAWQGGLGLPVLGFMAAHGPLELSAFLLAAQAGLAVAQALIEPGELSRAAAVQLRGREAARILAPVVPALALAALLEAAVLAGRGGACAGTGRPRAGAGRRALGVAAGRVAPRAGLGGPRVGSRSPASRRSKVQGSPCRALASATASTSTSTSKSSETTSAGSTSGSSSAARAVAGRCSAARSAAAALRASPGRAGAGGVASAGVRAGVTLTLRTAPARGAAARAGPCVAGARGARTLGSARAAGAPSTFTCEVRSGRMGPVVRARVFSSASSRANQRAALARTLAQRISSAVAMGSAAGAAGCAGASTMRAPAWRRNTSP